MSPAALNDVRLLTEPLARGAKLPSRLLEIRATTEVAQFHPLRVPPDGFFRIQFGRIAGEALQMDPRSRSLAEELLDRFAAVDRRPIPEDQELARDVAQQMLQESDHLRASDGLLVDLDAELLVQAHSTNDQEMIVAERVMQDRSLAYRGIGAHHRGEQIEAALID